MTDPRLEDTEEYAGEDPVVRSHFLESPPRAHLEFGAVTDRGSERPTNQDCFLITRRHRSRDVLASNLPLESFPPDNDEAFTLVVADGMGGMASGDVASRLALETAWTLEGREIKWPLKINEAEKDDLRDKAEVFWQLVEDALKQRAADEPELAGMGTTMTAAYTVGPHAFVIHAGDSRAYLLRNRKLHRLTRDHTLEERLTETTASANQTLPGSFRHILTNAIQAAPSSKVHVEVAYVLLREGDTLLLCTDGLSGSLNDDEITDTVLNNEQPEAACQALLKRALRQGGDDNITIIVARFSFGPESK